MALTYTQLADHTKNLLDGVSGIGVIYTTPQDFRDISEIEEKCVSGTPPRLNVWFISRKKILNSLRVSDGRPVPLGTGARIHEFLIRGFYGFIPDDEVGTYLTFQNLLTSICDEFQGKKQRASSVDSPMMLDTSEISIEGEDKVEFADSIICHYAEISIVYNELNNVTYL